MGLLTDECCGAGLGFSLLHTFAKRFLLRRQGHSRQPSCRADNLRRLASPSDSFRLRASTNILRNCQRARRNYTYVKYGRAVIGQPRRTAFQIFDQKVLELLREEYRIREVTRAEDVTLEGLARKLEIDPAGFVKTMHRVQRRRDEGRPVQPRRQGRPGHARHAAAEVELGPGRSTRRRTSATP